MFTNLLKKEWGKSIDKPIDPNNDCVVEDQSDKDDQDNHDEITDDFPYQIDSSSLDPTFSVLLNDPSTQENVDEQVSTLQDYDLDVDIEEELIRIFSSLAQEGIDNEGEQNDQYQEPSITDSLICESIEYLPCLVDDNFNHISEEEQSHDNYDTIVNEPSKKHPCPNGIDKIHHPILNQDVLVKCVNIDLVSDLAIIPRI